MAWEIIWILSLNPIWDQFKQKENKTICDQMASTPTTRVYTLHLKHLWRNKNEKGRKIPVYIKTLHNFFYSCPDVWSITYFRSWIPALSDSFLNAAYSAKRKSRRKHFLPTQVQSCTGSMTCTGQRRGPEVRSMFVSSRVVRHIRHCVRVTDNG